MQFFGSDKRRSAIATYSELESCALLLAATDAPLKREYADYKRYASIISRVFITGGTLHIIMDEGPPIGSDSVALAQAPRAARAKVDGLLAFFIPTGTAPAAINVTLFPPT